MNRNSARLAAVGVLYAFVVGISFPHRAARVARVEGLARRVVRRRASLVVARAGRRQFGGAAGAVLEDAVHEARVRDLGALARGVPE